MRPQTSKQFKTLISLYISQTILLPIAKSQFKDEMFRHILLIIAELPIKKKLLIIAELTSTHQRNHYIQAADV